MIKVKYKVYGLLATLFLFISHLSFGFIPFPSPAIESRVDHDNPFSSHSPLRSGFFYHQPIMAIYTPGLVWPRSDGDPSTWPSKAEQIASTTNNYWRQLAHDEGKYELYENAVGNFIAGKLGIKGELSIESIRQIARHQRQFSGFVADAASKRVRSVRSP